MKVLIFCCAFVVLTVVVAKDTESSDADIPFDNANTKTDRQTLLHTYCKTLCSSPLTCPRVCRQTYTEQQTSVDKRARGFLDGFTFDDYLFMRLLGRDMHGKR